MIDASWSTTTARCDGSSLSRTKRATPTCPAFRRSARRGPGRSEEQPPQLWDAPLPVRRWVAEVLVELLRDDPGRLAPDRDQGWGTSVGRRRRRRVGVRGGGTPLGATAAVVDPLPSGSEFQPAHSVLLSCWGVSSTGWAANVYRASQRLQIDLNYQSPRSTSRRSSARSAPPGRNSVSRGPPSMNSPSWSVVQGDTRHGVHV